MSKNSKEKLKPPNGPPGYCVFHPVRDEAVHQIIGGFPPKCGHLRREWETPHGQLMTLCDLVPQRQTTSIDQCPIYDRVEAERRSEKPAVENQQMVSGESLSF